MEEIENLKQEIAQIKERNRRVEKDKVWETSFTRRLLLIVFTYIVIGFYLQAINVGNPWLNAIVPAFGFLLSTLTLPFFKKAWSKYVYLKMGQAEQKNEYKEKILSMLKEKGRVANMDIEESLKIPERTIVRYMDELENEGKVQQVGKTGRGVVYELKS